MNKRILKFEIDLDFVLIAVTSPLKDYRLCYYINKQLNFNFTRQDDLELDIHHNSGPALFSMYHHYWETTETDFYFIGNKGTDGLLIPEMREVDYFFMIKNYIDDYELDELVIQLNKITEIVAAVKIDPKKIKSRENLLF